MCVSVVACAFNVMNVISIIFVLYQQRCPGNDEKGISVVRPPISSYGAGPDICGLTCLLCEHRASDFPLRLSFRRDPWNTDSCKKVSIFVGDNHAVFFLLFLCLSALNWELLLIFDLLFYLLLLYRLFYQPYPHTLFFRARCPPLSLTHTLSPLITSPFISLSVFRFIYVVTWSLIEINTEQPAARRFVSSFDLIAFSFSSLLAYMGRVLICSWSSDSYCCPVLSIVLSIVAYIFLFFVLYIFFFIFLCVVLYIALSFVISTTVSFPLYLLFSFFSHLSIQLIIGPH